MKLTCFIGHLGIAAANTSYIQYFDGVDRRDRYKEFYEQLVHVKDKLVCVKDDKLVRVKDIATLPFANNAQKLLVKYIREDLLQLLAANWYEGHWTGPFGQYSLAHAG